MREKLLALLVPPFLRKLDRWLLLNHPRWWASKFHYFIFYGLLVNLLAALFVFFIRLPFNQLMYFKTNMITISLLIEGCIFIFWLYIQSLFSVEQEYGNKNHTSQWIETILCTICVLLIFSPAIIMLVTGVYKTAYDLKIRGHNICEGPMMLEFYSNSELNTLQQSDHDDMNALQKGLALSEKVTISGQTKQVIGIEYAIFRFAGGMISYHQISDAISIDSDETVRVENGEATIKVVSGSGKIIIKHAGNMLAVKSDEQATVMAGDEITAITNHPEFPYDAGRFNVVSGAISTRSFYSTYIAKDNAVIIEDGREMKLVTGEITTVTNTRIWRFVNGDGDLAIDDKAYETCQGVKYFLSDINAYLKNDIFEFGAFALVNIIFTILGVFFTVILKHTNWRIIIYSFFYILVAYVFASILSTLLSYGSRSQEQSFGNSMYANGIGSIGTSSVFLIVIVIFVLFALIWSIQLIKAKKYKLFPFINFVSLPTVLGYLIYIVAYQGNVNSNNFYYIQWFELKNIILVLSIFFLCYLLFAPIFKKTLIYLMSLPRE